MNKVLYSIATVFQIILMIGSFVFNFFTRRKMGMARWVIYMNQGWEKNYPVVQIKNISMALIVLLGIIGLGLFMKNREKVKLKGKMMNVLMVITTGFYLWFMLSHNRNDLRAYYFIGIMLFVLALLQAVKAIVTNLGAKNEK